MDNSVIGVNTQEGEKENGVTIYRFPELIPTGIRRTDSARLCAILMERVWVSAIRRLMAAKGWRQQQLAEASHVRPNTISDALNGRNPRIDTMEALAKGLGVPMWALFVDEREYGLVQHHLQQADVALLESKRRDEVRAAVQEEFAPLVDAIVAKITGQSTAAPAKPLAEPARPRLAATGSRKKR